MPQLTYSVRLTVDGSTGVNIGSQLDEMTLTTGSSDGYDQPQPATLNMAFLNTPKIGTIEQGAFWWIGRAILVELKDSDSGAYTKIFQGRVTQANVSAEDSKGLVNRVEISALSYMADLQTAKTRDAYIPAILPENTAIDTLITQAIASWQWNEVFSSQQWLDVPSATTWATYDALYDVPTVTYLNTSGTYWLMSMGTFTSGSALELLQDFAISNMAWTYDDPDTGAIVYAAYQEWATSAGYVTQTLTDVALAESLQASASISNVFNDITVKNVVTGDILTWGNLDLINKYGLNSFEYSSYLNETADRNFFLAIKSKMYGTPNTTLSTVTIDLDQLPAQRWLWYYTTYPTKWLLTGIPAAYGGSQIFWRTGITLNVSYYHAEATAVLTPVTAFGGATQWALIDGRYDWNGSKPYSLGAWNALI